MEPKSYTEEEVREQFLDHMRSLVSYWRSVGGRTEKERMEGLCFSILNIFDGTTCALPALDIVLRPHPSDKEIHINEGQRWYEDGMVINNCMLHDLWYKKS